MLCFLDKLMGLDKLPGAGRLVFYLFEVFSRHNGPDNLTRPIVKGGPHHAREDPPQDKGGQDNQGGVFQGSLKTLIQYVIHVRHPSPVWRP